MWRFILVSFAFLGWSFYVLSGGADYTPHGQSLQAHAKISDVQPSHIAVTPLGDDAAIDSANAAPLADPAASKAQVTLASINIDTLAKAVPTATLNALAETPQVPRDLIQEAAIQTLDPLDIRYVNSANVNLRDGPSLFYLVIDTLDTNTQVEIVEEPGDGWLKIRVLDTGQVGWMADWLVATAAN